MKCRILFIIMSMLKINIIDKVVKGKVVKRMKLNNINKIFKFKYYL